jgi:hypothetical protein
MNFYSQREKGDENFEPVYDRDHGQFKRRSRDGRARCRTKLTGMRSARP